MPNDFLSLWSSPRSSARSVEGTTELAPRARWAALTLLACIVLPSCGEAEDNSVTYDDDIRPIFNRRCTTCHHATSPIGVDITSPFSLGNGLVNAPNSWAAEDAYPGLTDAQNVVPFDPEASFLMDKITGNLPEQGGGAAMPLQVSPLDEGELAAMEQWVADGAQDNEFFRDNIRPIFGSENSPGEYYGGKCIYCHYSGSPNPLDLSEPFGPDGLVNIDATYRGDMVRVLPGDPDNSLLILKVRAQRPDSDIGAQMPYSYNPLTDSQVDLVRQWIVEGAKP